MAATQTDGFSVPLLVAAAAVALAWWLVLGTVAALRRGTWLVYAASVGALLGVSVPVFVWGLVLLLTFSLHWRVFPTSGAGATLARGRVPA